MTIYRQATEPTDIPPAPPGATTLPGGHWALLRESTADAPRRLTRGIDAAKRPGMLAWASLPEDVRPRDDAESTLAGPALLAAVATLPQDLQDAFFEVQERVTAATVVALVLEWSFPAAPSAEALDDLPAAVWDALAAEAEERSKFQLADDTLAALADPTPLRVGYTA